MSIIGAVGDSISAGVGATALNIIDVFNEVKPCTSITTSQVPQPTSMDVTFKSVGGPDFILIYKLSSLKATLVSKLY